MNGLDNAVIMEVLSWKIKFSVNGRILSRKSSPKFYFENRIKNVIKRNLVKRCMVCLFNKLVRLFVEQVPHIIVSINTTLNLYMKVLQNNATFQSVKN